MYVLTCSKIWTFWALGKALSYFPGMGLFPIGVSDIGLIPDLLDGIEGKFGVAADEGAGMVHGLGNE